MFRNFFVLLLFLCSSPLWSQFDSFQYVVVPVQFEAFKQANMHKTSTMVKFYLDQRGYPAVYDLGRPDVLTAYPCKAVYTQFIDDSNLFATRVILRFVDCEGKIVFETTQGYSKEKEYKVAYREVIEQAFTSFDGLSYSYSPPATSEKEEVEVASEATPKPEETEVEVAVTPVAVATPSTKEMPEDPAEPSESQAAAPSETQAAAPSGTQAILYAQPIEGGFQLVDSTPKIRMLLMESSRGEGIYMAVVDGNSAGTVYREGETWIHEYFKEGKVVRSPLTIKF